MKINKIEIISLILSILGIVFSPLLPIMQFAFSYLSNAVPYPASLHCMIALYIIAFALSALFSCISLFISIKTLRKIRKNNMPPGLLILAALLLSIFNLTFFIISLMVK